MRFRGAHASRVLVAASRRHFCGFFEDEGCLWRDARGDTRDACAPRTTEPTSPKFPLSNNQFPIFNSIEGSAQGCEERATLGEFAELDINPNGVARAGGGGATPLGLETMVGRLTQGSLASSATLGWMDTIPLGLESRNYQFQILNSQFQIGWKRLGIGN